MTLIIQYFDMSTDGGIPTVVSHDKWDRSTPAIGDRIIYSAPARMYLVKDVFWSFSDDESLESVTVQAWQA